MALSTRISRSRMQPRKLGDLISVGPAILKDFERLGIGSIAQLRKSDPQSLYRRLCRLTRQRQDICVLDVFQAAVAQARNPRLPAQRCVWWYWSRRRRGEIAGAQNQA